MKSVKRRLFVLSSASLIHDKTLTGAPAARQHSPHVSTDTKMDRWHPGAAGCHPGRFPRESHLVPALEPESFLRKGFRASPVRGAGTSRRDWTGGAFWDHRP